MAGRDVVFNLIGRDKASSAFRSVGDSADASESRLKSFAKTAARTGAAAAAALGVGAAVAGKALFETAVKVEALGNKARVVFGKSFPVASRAARKLSTDLGMTETQVVGLLAAFGDLLTPMGFTAKRATTMSIRLGTLTAALTQWSGGTRTSAEVADILADALTGEYDSLKSLGVQIDADLIKTRLHAQGKDKLTGAALKQAQAEIALKEITAQSSNALKGYSDRTNTLGLAQQKLASQIGTVKEQLATSLLPSFVAATTWISTQFVPGVRKLNDEFMTKFGPTIQRVSEFMQTSVIPIFRMMFSDPVVQAGLKKLAVGVIGLVAGVIALSAALAAMGATSVAALAWLTEKAGPALKALSGHIASVMTAISGLGTTAETTMRTLTSAITRGMAAMIGAMSGLGATAERTMRTLGAAIVNGLVGGVRAGVGAVRQAAADLIASIPATARKLLGIASPSRVMMRIGGHTTHGLALGIRSKASVVRSAIEAVIGRARKVWQTQMDKLTSLRQARSGLVSSVAGGVLGTSGLIGEGGGGTLARMRGSVTAAAELLQKLQALRRLGLSGGLLAQIAGAGPEQGLATARDLLSGGRGSVRAANASQSALGRLAGGIGGLAGDAVYGRAIGAQARVVGAARRGMLSATGAGATINVTVAPGGDPAEVGRQIVAAIRQYERRSGSRWRAR